MHWIVQLGRLLPWVALVREIGDAIGDLGVAKDAARQCALRLRRAGRRRAVFQVLSQARCEPAYRLYVHARPDLDNRRVGDRIKINADKKTDEGWAHGTIESTGSYGFFPTNFIEILNEAPASQRLPPSGSLYFPRHTHTRSQ